MNIARISKSIGIACLATAVIWLMAPPLWPTSADAYHTDPSAVPIMTLAAPPTGFHSVQKKDDAGFPESTAGFSAYFRYAAGSGGDASGTSDHSIDVVAVVDALLLPPAASDPFRQQAGTLVDMGSNYAVMSLPVKPAVDKPLPPATVYIYIDDLGWVVAYLPTGEPAAAVWRHGTTSDSGSGEAPAQADLENNLLVQGIFATLTSAGYDASGVTHSTVGYYDWEHPECDAFALFSNRAGVSEAHPVEFLVPAAITDLHGSAAVIITTPTEEGSEAFGQLTVDGRAAATARAGDGLRMVEHFDLSRSDGSVSEHKMSVVASAGIAAAGAVVLLYDRPGS